MTLDEIRKRVEEIKLKDDSEYKTKLLMGIERQLEEYDDHFLMFDVKNCIIESAVFSGQVEIAIAYSTWLFTAELKVIEIHKITKINRTYSWLLETSNFYPYFSKEKTNEFFNDFEKFCLEYDISLFNLYKYKTIVAQESGNKKLADEYYKMWENTRRSFFFSDCKTCDISDKATYAIKSGDTIKAEEKISEVFKTDFACKEAPLFVYPTIAVYYFKLGKFEEAYNYHILGLEGLENNKKMIYPVARHMLYCANMYTNKALDLFISYSHHLVRLTNVREKLNFYIGAYVLFNNLLSDGQDTVCMNIDENLPFYSNCNDYSCYVLKNYFYDEILRLAGLFNQRNENTYVLDQAKENISAFIR